MLVKKLAGMRSPMANVLEKRIDLTERIQLLTLKKIRTIARPELVSHLSHMDSAGVQLPFRVRLDLLEMQLDWAIGDFMTSPVDVSDMDVASSIADKFNFWKPALGDLKESNLTIMHILTAEDARHQLQRVNGDISAEDEADAKAKCAEADCD